MSLTFECSAFAEGQEIPRRHTGDGEDLSPAVSWSTLPAETRELALIVDDPDAPTDEPWVHWIIYNIPAEAGSLPEGVPQSSHPEAPRGAVQGRNSWGTLGYRGPAPPAGHGIHHYHFKLYALDEGLGLPPNLDKKELMLAMSGHILGHDELVGTYQR
jgi:Raf kinase inhibitor-like YbhB/YbcL family protein